MKYIWFLPLILSACGTITAESTQPITIATTPAGAQCELSNREGNWTLEQTPSTIMVARSYSPLKISCEKGGKKGEASLQPSTRAMTYGNIALGGFPAYIDAATGAAYEYEAGSVEITLN